MENDNQHDDQHDSDVTLIPLDGSFGAGPVAEVTIVTKAPGGQHAEETFQVPYFIVDKKVLQKMADINFILGYKIVKNEKINPALKELGL